MTQKRSILKSLLYSAVPVAITATASALLVDTRSPWYAALQKPAINPPPWVFSVAWSIVYLCVALALYRILRKGRTLPESCGWALTLCGLLNIAWTLVFFRLHAMHPAAAVLAVLLCLLVLAFIRLFPKEKISAWLLAPHILWGAFAFALNISFILCNA